MQVDSLPYTETVTEWIWERSADGTARFVLGTVGKNPLVCFGINPSTATPHSLDRTVNRVSKFAEREPFDSWIMLNVYPQISTDPKGMHLDYDLALKRENELHIARLIDGRPRTILAAWGNLIESRPYLWDAMRDIALIAELASSRWISLGEPTTSGHPRHPLYVKSTTPFIDFDIPNYLA